MPRLLLKVVEYPSEEIILIEDLTEEGKKEVIREADDLIKEIGGIK